MPKTIFLGLTMGCPAGIGPEICLKALNHPWPEDLRLVVLGDQLILAHYAHNFGLSQNWSVLQSPLEIPAQKRHCVLNLSSLKTPCPGKPNLETAQAMVSYIKKGVELCLKGILNGLVTAPISKAALKLAGQPFPGHTEMLAHLTQTNEYAMAFYGQKLKIVLATIHVALSQVPLLINVDQILRVTRLAYNFLKTDLGLSAPRLALAALNPHASEGGLFGEEEEKILSPAVLQAQKQGLPLEGPFPSDSLFFRALQGEFDLVVSLYHDQGLIPFKLLHFEDGVNLTLGLPIVRTSVDHGTAYDLAGKGLAKPYSLYEAIKLAYKMASNRLRLSPGD